VLQWEGGGAEVSDCRIYIEKKKKKIRFLRLLMPYNIKNSTAVEKPILSSTDLE